MAAGKTGREWVLEAGKRIGLTEVEIEDMLRAGVEKTSELSATS